MGQGEILSESYREIVGDSVLTMSVDTATKNFEILNSSVKRFTEELKCITEEEEEEGYKKNIEIEYPSLDFPKLGDFLYYTNEKQFSKKIQKWKGIVLEHNENIFKAKLYDLSSGGTYEIGEFENEDISPDDLNLLADGAIFYWSVGHYMENGQSVKRSDIRFQRLVTLDEEEIMISLENVKRKYSNLKERKIDNK